jgi:hypothetical protein
MAERLPELAPVDPRSLMQGDFTWRCGSEHRMKRRGAPKKGLEDSHRAAADERGVAKFRRLDEAAACHG